MKFEADSFDVQLVNSGERSIDMVESFTPDIVLMDLQMPKMGGEEALTVMHTNEWGKDIPVTLLTNLGEVEAPKGPRALGIHSYIV